MRRPLLVLGLVLAVLLAGCAQVPRQRPPEGPMVHRAIVAGRALTYCATHPIEEWTPAVQHVIVAVHGLDLNACGMRRAVLDALGGEPGGTIVVAPHFPVVAQAVPGGHAWAPNAWPAGQDSTAGVSSFEVMDALVASFGERRVTLVGFSGGGQFTNRYAVASPVTLGRYVVINPSSYVWFSPDRPGPTADCPTYNRWRYGLEERQGYTGRGTDDELRARYAARDVRYLIGLTDDDPLAGSLDRTCGAMAQGPDRETRARAYHAHLIDVFGDGIHDRHPLGLVPGVGHEVGGMLRNPLGRDALEGDS